MKLETNGISTHYVSDGEGNKPWLVLSHSIACTLDMWEPQLAALTKYFRVLRYDVRGHGKSGAPAGEYSMAMLAGDIDSLLAQLKINRCHFVGLSMGGMIGQVYALQPNSRVASLVLADTTGRWPAESMPVWADRIKTTETKGMTPFAEPALHRWFTPPFHKREPDTIARVRGWIENTDPVGFVGASYAVPRTDTLDQLHLFKAPMLILVGAEDTGTPPSMSYALHEAAPGSKIRVIPSSAHLCNMEQPESFNSALLEFYRDNKIIGAA